MYTKYYPGCFVPNFIENCIDENRVQHEKCCITLRPGFSYLESFEFLLIFKLNIAVDPSKEVSYCSSHPTIGAELFLK